ncbi:MAG TPA: hypothetical protein DD381_07830 [Lentisphaeria bacterium]|nr:MAG: hypothetical protein A2X47_04395 [Lentisphaerae bacterium GWF2_38_69]HBM16231.1 hypothetical protein [Lentisphaeria bacterium]
MLTFNSLIFEMRKLPSLSGSAGIKSLARKEEISSAKKSGIAMIILVMAITIFGLLMLYSTTSTASGESMLIKQVMWIIVGIFAITFINLVGYNALLPYSKYILIITWLLLIFALFCKPVNGAYRWIPIPGGIGNIQPSELAKIAIIMFLAHFIPRNQRNLKSSFKALLFPGIVCAITLMLVLSGHDLGTTILIASVIWILALIAGIKLRLLLPPLALLAFLPFFLKYADKMRWARVTSFLNPEIYQKTIGYQLWFSLLALGSGSWTGLGFTNSRMKAQYLPEAHTDFILSIVGEELGYIALLLLICGYIAFLCLSVYISIKAKDKEGMLLGFGCSVMLALQSIINIGVVSGAFPTKGMPAPFVSYGGSNMIVCLLCAGFILSISNPRKNDTQEPTKSVQLKKNKKASRS